MRFIILFLLIAVVSLPAHAENPCMAGMKYAGIIVGGDANRFSLSGHGVQFGLSDVVIFNPKPLTQKTGAHVELYSSHKKPDRHGRLMGHGFTGEGKSKIWLQGKLVASGRAVTGSMVTEPARRNKLLQLETSARQNSMGVWQKTNVQLPADEVGKLLAREGRFQLVTGKILSLGDRKKRLYLNFGSNWKQDFTVVIEKTGKRAYAGDLTKLKQGAFVRVRGILENSGGPLIRVTHEAQIEINVD